MLIVKTSPLAAQESNQSVVGSPARSIVIFLQKSIWLLSRYWLFAANFLAGAILTLGFLAPAFMSAGLTVQGQAVYRALAPHNHQLPQRSYFLFGQAGGIQTYSLGASVVLGGRSATSCKILLETRTLALKRP